MDGFLIGLSSASEVQDQNQPLLKNYRKENQENSDTESLENLKMKNNLFKPINTVTTTPPKQFTNGQITDTNLRKVTPLKLNFTKNQSSSSDINIIQSNNIPSSPSAFVETTQNTEKEYKCSSKRIKLSENEFTNGDVLKSITINNKNDIDEKLSPEQDILKINDKTNVINENLLLFEKEEFNEKNEENDLFETQDYLSINPKIENKLIEEQKRIEEIIMQEKKDRELALKLSQEWEIEIKKPLTRSMVTKSSTRKSNSSLKNLKKKEKLNVSTTSFTLHDKKINT